jgi:hypothetical protein
MLQRRIATVPIGILASLMLLAATGVARAQGPTLTVSNLGQSSAPIEVGQPPFEVPPAGSCAFPFTLANESACPAGIWPPLGRRWGAIEDVAGGDTLRLEFAAPVSAVTVGSTSNYEPGLHDPDGKAIGNYDVIAESPAAPTSDPSAWTVTLPPLDVRAISTDGYTFSVVAQDGSGYHDYPFGIRSPRYANELTKCSQAYYSTGFWQYLCLGKGGGGLPDNGLRNRGASYDGHTFTLKLEVPKAGTLLLRIPTTCGPGIKPAECHRKTSIVRHLAKPATITIRKSLSLRPGPDRRMSMPIRFYLPSGELNEIGTMRVRVRFQHK